MRFAAACGLRFGSVRVPNQTPHPAPYPTAPQPPPSQPLHPLQPLQPDQPAPLAPPASPPAPPAPPDSPAPPAPPAPSLQPPPAPAPPAPKPSSAPPSSMLDGWRAEIRFHGGSCLSRFRRFTVHTVPSRARFLAVRFRLAVRFAAFLKLRKSPKWRFPKFGVPDWGPYKKKFYCWSLFLDPD